MGKGGVDDDGDTLPLRHFDFAPFSLFVSVHARGYFRSKPLAGTSKRSSEKNSPFVYPREK